MGRLRRTGSDARVHAYALMGNHSHLLVEGPVSALARTLKHVGENYTRRFNGKYGLDGPIFGGRHRSRPIDGDRQLFVSESRGDASAGGFTERRRPVRTGTPAAIDWALGIDSSDELELVRADGLRADLRLAAALLALETTHRSSTELAVRYGYRSGSGVRTSAARARARLASDPAFRALVDDARRRLRFLDRPEEVGPFRSRVSDTGATGQGDQRAGRVVGPRKA